MSIDVAIQLLQNRRWEDLEDYFDYSSEIIDAIIDLKANYDILVRHILNYEDKLKIDGKNTKKEVLEDIQVLKDIEVLK